MPDFAFGPGEDAILPGSNGGIPIHVRGETGMSRIGVVVRFDPGQLEVSGIGPGPDAPTDVVIETARAIPAMPEVQTSMLG